jgi:hypothetical protein
MVKHNDDEIESLGQLVASLTRELVDKSSGLGTGEKIKTNQQTPKTKNTSISSLFPFFYSSFRSPRPHI